MNRQRPVGKQCEQRLLSSTQQQNHERTRNWLSNAPKRPRFISLWPWSHASGFKERKSAPASNELRDAKWWKKPSDDVTWKRWESALGSMLLRHRCDFFPFFFSQLEKEKPFSPFLAWIASLKVKIILAYAIEVITVYNRDRLRQIRVAYNSIFRRIFGYRNYESLRALQSFLGRPNWEQLIENRTSKLLENIRNDTILNIFFWNFYVFFLFPLRDTTISLWINRILAYHFQFPLATNTIGRYFSKYVRAKVLALSGASGQWWAACKKLVNHPNWQEDLHRQALSYAAM